jgi:hypothetical protein
MQEVYQSSFCFINFSAFFSRAMDIHLVLSALPSMLTSLLAINKASMFLFITHHPNNSVNLIKKN